MLASLNRIIQEISTTKELPAVLNHLLDHIVVTLSVDAASIFLIDTESGEYILSAAQGMKETAVGKFRLKLGQGVIGRVVEREEPINIADCQTNEYFHKSQALGEKPYHGFLAVPIIHQGEAVGVIVVYRKSIGELEEDVEAYLITLSAQISNPIAHSISRGVIASIAVGGRKRKKKELILLGLSGAAGVALGKAVLVYPPADLDAVPDRKVDDIEHENKLFEAALAAAREEIQALQTRAKSGLSIAESALFDAYLRILDSRSLMNEVEAEIEAGLWAQASLRRVINRHVLKFESLSDDYLRERASDFRDLGRRILSHLQANKRETPDYPKKTILVSEEVTATMLMEVPEGCLVGVISGSGSSNSHVAILARALGLPTVMGVTGTSISELAGREIIVDGYNGQVYLSPSAALRKEFKQIALEEQQFDEELTVLRDKPAETIDKHQIKLFVNTGLAVEGGLSLSVGAEGVGLYRTELPFMLRDRFPGEEEQRIMYRQLLNTFSPKPVVMRTLDIGGDKPLPYFPIVEDNPFLGWRGIRVTLDHPEIFLQQVRAMLAASVGLNNLAIMLPMITSVSEVEAAERMIQQAYDELTEEGLEISMPSMGIMIEVPAAVYQAVELAKRVDFISVGSNDLIQYLLAVDRNNPRVANLYNAFHPAVIRALYSIAKAGKKTGKAVSICGEMASDPVAAILLVAMGYDALSMSARSILRVKWAIRNYSLEKAQVLLKEILKIDDPIEVRVHLEIALEEAGLGGLIRAGR
jgi:phosphotransferase system enzyme I (PtsP)